MLLNEIYGTKYHPEAWGFQLILDCKQCKSDITIDKKKLVKFIEDLVKEIDMVAVGDPIVKHFPARDPDKTGLSLVQLIETSSITCHCVDNSKNAYIDIFSCKEFSYEDAAEFVKENLKPDHIRTTFLTREA